MKNGMVYQVIDVDSLQEGIEAKRRGLTVPNGNWVINEVTMTGRGSWPLAPRFFGYPYFRENVTTISMDVVMTEILGASLLVIGEYGAQFPVLGENAIYYSSQPFLIIHERIVRLPGHGKKPYARRYLVLPRQVHNGELGMYLHCDQPLAVKQNRPGGSEPYEWICLAELAEFTSIDSRILADDYLWPSYLEMPRSQPPFVVAENEESMEAGRYEEIAKSLDPKMTLMRSVKGLLWAHMVWVALPMARAIIHFTALNFQVGDRSDEVPLLLSMENL